MPRAISLSDLNALHVDGSFDRMNQDALEEADGDKSKALDFLTGSVLKGLMEKFAAGDHDHETDNRAKAHGHDDYHQGPHDDLPPELTNHIENIRGTTTNILLVMEKKITASDLKKNQNRLLFCKNSGINKLRISQEERKKVNQPRGLQVKVIQPCLETTQEVEFKKRTKNNRRYSEFVLTRNWIKIAENEMNNLQTNDTVKLWSFRKGSELYFALVKT